MDLSMLRIEELADIAGQLTIVVTAVTALAALVILVAKSRIDGRKSIAEAANVEQDTVIDKKRDAINEAGTIIGWLELQRKEQDRVHELERERHRAEMLEQRDYYETSLDKLRRRLEGKIDRLERRVSDFGCKKAPNCMTRDPLTLVSEAMYLSTEVTD